MLSARYFESGGASAPSYASVPLVVCDVVGVVHLGVVSVFGGVDVPGGVAFGGVSNLGVLGVGVLVLGAAALGPGSVSIPAAMRRPRRRSICFFQSLSIFLKVLSALTPLCRSHNVNSRHPPFSNNMAPSKVILLTLVASGRAFVPAPAPHAPLQRSSMEEAVAEAEAAAEPAVVMDSPRTPPRSPTRHHYACLPEEI